MAYQSVWYFTDLPKDIVDIIERDVSQRFDVQMQDSRLAGDELNKEKRNSQKCLDLLLITGSVVSCGIIFNAQTVRTFCMI